ncbi:SDR family oxidoreductase [Pedobacter jamesrossensis]|uniref:SDR family oxidoreductase n=1 Tax=Pedobacter jamesrossensis TaxID=1908238 RepID=A0ABV8NL77_9SPHI
MNLNANKNTIKTVSILGCGWFGLALAKKLVATGYTVNGSTTTPEKLKSLSENGINAFQVNFTAESIEADETFFLTDVLFICIPPKRNSSELNNYPDKIKAILKSAEGKTAKFILISSTSVYGDENTAVNERSETNPDTDSGKMVLAAEQILKETCPIDFTIIRFAGLIGPERNPGRFFAGKKNIPNGLAPVNLIHQQDAVGVAEAILKNEAFGRIYNACSPEHPTKKDFYTNAAKETGLEIPSFLEEKRSWKIVEGLNVPEFLDYKFQIKI